MKSKIIYLMFLFSLFIFIGCNKALEQLDQPGEITLEESIFSITPVEHAKTYVIYVNNEVFLTTSDLTFALNIYGQIEVSYIAQADGYNDSIRSETYLFNIEPVTSERHFTYSKSSTFDLLIFDDYNIDSMSYSMTLEDVGLLSSNNYISDDHSIHLKGDYLNQLLVSEDPLHFILNTDQGIHDIYIRMTDNNKPYVYTPNNVAFEGDSLTFGFELYQSELISLTTNESVNLTEEDYSIEGNLLTIKHDYLQQVFEQNSSFYTIVITYQLKDSTSGDIYIGYLLIHNPS